MNRGYITQRGKNKNKWRIVVSAGKDIETGKRIQKTYTFEGTKKDANIFLTEKLQEIDKGIFCTSKNMPFSDYLNYWFEQHCKLNLKQTTCIGYLQKIKNDIIPILGNIKLQDLTPLHLQSFYSLKLQNGLSKKTVRQLHAIIHSALKQASKWHLVAINVADNVEAPKPDAYKPIILSKEDISKLIDVAKNSDIYIVIMIGIYTGMRRGEICGLQWQNVDLINNCIIVDKALYKTKNGLVFDTPKSRKSIRKISISNTLTNILKEEFKKQKELQKIYGNLYQYNNLVCCNEDGSMLDPDCICPKFKRILKKNNLPNVRFHDLRHSHASLLLEQGTHLKVISDRLGHSTISITADTYTHVNDCVNQELADNFDTLFV